MTRKQTWELFSLVVQSHQDLFVMKGLEILVDVGVRTD
jgi:hypothetical protein